MKNQIPTVHELRKRGWKVKVGHFRRFYRFDERTGKKNVVTVLWEDQKTNYPDYYLDARGGYTIVSINIPDFKEVQGSSVCSNQELYSKKYGTKKAIARALSEWEVSKQQIG